MREPNPKVRIQLFKIWNGFKLLLFNFFIKFRHKPYNDRFYESLTNIPTRKQLIHVFQQCAQLSGSHNNYQHWLAKFKVSNAINKWRYSTSRTEEPTASSYR